MNEVETTEARWQDAPKFNWWAERLERERLARENARTRGLIFWWAWNMSGTWKANYPRIVTISIWIGLFIFLLPYEFREVAWPWLTVKILGSVILSAMISGAAAGIAYLLFKA